MSNWTLRLALATSVTSLAVSGMTLGIVLRRPPAAPPSAPPVAATSFASHGGSGSGLGDSSRVYQIIDPATRKPTLVTLPDESARIEKFVIQAKLSRAQELALREDFGKHLENERAMAEKMVGAGQWNFAAITEINQQFWGDVIEALPPAQTEAVDPSFFPPLPSPSAPHKR